MKVKTTKELTEEISILKKENDDLKKQFEKLADTMNGITEKLNRREISKKPQIREFKCIQCEKHFDSKAILKEHRMLSHPRKIECKHCDEYFYEVWKLEHHMKKHEGLKKFICEKCEKEFHIEWRLKKHREVHEQQTKKCHYFNNSKTCPYEEIGCKFAHRISENCYFQDKCRNQLCQFRHSLDDNVINSNTTKPGETEINEVAQQNDESPPKDRYESMDEGDKYEIGEEICIRNCWQGYHKCYPKIKENELIGVDVKQIKEDFKNCVDEEMYYCEICTFKNKEMTQVQECNIFCCWECDMKTKTINEFKRHIGNCHDIQQLNKK